MNRPSRILFCADSLPGNLGLYSLATILFRSVSLLRMVIITWLLGPAMFGLVSLGLAFINIGWSVVLLGAPAALERYIPLHQNNGQLRPFLRRLLPICIAVAVLGTVLLALNINSLSSLIFSRVADSARQTYQADFPKLTAACLATLLASACFNTLISCLKGLRFFRAVAVLECSQSVLFTVLAVLLLLGHRHPFIVFSAQAATLVLLVVTVGSLLFAHLRRCPDQNLPLTSSSYLSRFTAFAFWGLPGTVTWTILLAFPLWYLNRTFGPNITGTYSAYFTLLNAVFFLSMPFWSVINIHAVRKWVRAEYDQAKATVELAFRAFSLSLMFLCLLLTLCAPLLRRLFPSDFASGANYVRFLCIPPLLAANFGLIHLLASLLEKPSLRVLALALGTVIVLLAGIFLIPQYGIAGAAFSGALGLSSATLAGLLLLLLRRCTLSFPTLLVLACPALLLIPNRLMMIAAFVLLLVLVVFTPLFFAGREKLRLIDSARNLFKSYWPSKVHS